MNDATEIDRLFDEAAALYEQGQLAEAERRCHNLCDAHPTYAPAVGLMGVILCQTGRGEIGVQFIEKATDLAPDEAAFFNNLGTAYTGLKRFDEALGAFARAIDLAPDNAQAHNNIGAVLRPLGRLADAAAHYAKAVELDPDGGEIWANYANVLMELDRVDEAARAAEKAVTLSPEYAAGHNNLGTVRQRQGRYGDAEKHYRRALGLHGDYADAHANLAEVMKETGRAAEAMAHYDRAVELRPGEPDLGSNRLYGLCPVDGMAPQAIAEAHAAWGDRVAAALPSPASPSVDRNVDRRLRIGYVSPDFRRHSVAYFFEPIVEHHDRQAVEVFCYANMPTPGDAVTDRLRGHADHWRNVFGLSDAAFAAQVRDDRIDIAVDLTGHTRANRLTAFALKPAPVQISYLGYPATTGLAAVDYRLSDGWADPKGLTEAWHREQLLRMDAGFLCYRPDGDAPDVAPLPARTAGHVTFGSFNNLAKVTPAVIAAWAAVLHAVPGSRLALKAKALGDPGTAERLRAAFAGHDIDARRIDCLGWIVDASPLAAYNHVDIGLDTFPYNGTTTTCEALWMGVPVLTPVGDWHAARVGVSLMSKVGLADWIADDRQSYAALAQQKAADLDGLAALRAGLRGRLQTSGLTDGAGFAGALEDTYRRAWRGGT